MMAPMVHESALAMLDGHADPVLLVDSTGAFRWMNAAARAQLPVPVYGIDAFDLTLSDLERASEAPRDLELPGPSADGRAVWRLRVSATVGDQRLLTLTPVGDLARQAARATDLAQKLDIAQEFGRLGLWERDLRTLTGRWDPHVFRMWGLETATGTPTFAEATASIVDEDRRSLEDAFLASVARPGTYSHRFRVRRPDGSLCRLHSQWVVIEGADGRPARALGVMVDDTEAWDLARSHDAALTQLAVAVDVGRLAIWRRAVDSSRVRCNHVMRRLLGLDPTQEDFPLRRLLGIVHPEDRAVVRTGVSQALQSDEPVDFELRVRRSDGHWRHVHTRLTVERGSDGRPLEFIGVSLDVTRRRDEARRARELVRRFNLAARTAGIGHWSLERGATRARWSEQLYALHGLPVGSTVPVWDDWLAAHVRATDRESLRRAYHDWRGSGRPSLEVEFRLLRADGAERQVIAHSRVEGRGAESLVYGIVIDVTERRAAEDALREAAERAALIAHGVGIGTWELEITSGAARWDAQMFRLRGLRPGPRALPPQDRLALVHPDDRAAVQTMTARMDQEAGPVEHEFRVVWPDGSVHWLASRSTAVCDPGGRPLRRVGVNWDITDARSVAAEREERLAAQREVRAKLQFLARMSHELRTPLNAVLGFTQLLLDGDAEGAPQARARRLEQIRAAGQHLLALIDDVLDLSQLEGGDVTIDLQAVPLAPLVGDVVALVEPLARSMGVPLQVSAADAVALADPARLRQVLVNLLTRAVRRTRDGGDVRLEVTAGEGVVAISVTDTGHGLTPQQLQHLFEPFSEPGHAAAGAATGDTETGIGLAIVKALVERMRGTVHVDSDPARGSRFELRLRDADDAVTALQPQASAQALALAATAGRVGRGGTVLYIEDNDVNTMIVGELLAQRSDLKLLTASTGLGGLEIAQSARPHLVLLDMQLPDIDGYEVFRRLRAHPRTARIPCIAVSANAIPDDIERALRAGFADYWTKPLDFRTFMASIEALFGPAP